MKSHEREARKGCYEGMSKTPHFAGFFMPGAGVGWLQVRKYLQLEMSFRKIAKPYKNARISVSSYRGYPITG